MIGGDLGASYRVEPPAQVINLKKDTDNAADDEDTSDDVDDKSKKSGAKK